MFKVTVHEVLEEFFFGRGAETKKEAKKSRSRERLQGPSARGRGQQQAKEWRGRAEELSKRYAALREAYKQVKKKAQSAEAWRHRCQKLLNQLLRVTEACDLTGAVDRTGDPDQTLDGILTGIRQLRDQILGSLCEIGLLQPIEPKPGEKFDGVRCIAIGTGPDENDDDAVVGEVVEPGYAHHDQVVRRAKVKLDQEPSTKSEARNPRQMPMTQAQNPKGDFPS